MNALWGLGHMMMLTRVLVIVDADVDVQDTRSVAWFVLNNLAPERDVVTMPGPVDDLDHGSYSVAYGTKLGIDATRKSRRRRIHARMAAGHRDGRATRALVSKRWREYGLDRICQIAASRRLVGSRSRCLRAVEALVTKARSLREIRIEHTLFALPFAYVGAVLAARGVPSAWSLLWITLAVFGARTAAMAANRYFDRDIDARNPRTARRAVASGVLPSVGHGLGDRGRLCATC